MRSSLFVRGAVLALGLLVVSGIAGAQVINGFGNMMLNGSAQLVGPTLRLTDAAVGGVGSGFDMTPLVVDTEIGFNAWFQFSIHSGSGADGFTFCIQNDGDGASALGGGGGGLGYLGISPSVAVEFDTFDNGGKGENAIGINLDGSLASIASTQVTPDMEDAGSLYAWVEYDGTSDTLDVYFSDTNSQPDTPVVSATVDLAALGSQAYVGFTASTGGLTNTHDIEDFQLIWGAGVPTMPAWGGIAFLLVLLTIGIAVHRRTLIGTHA